MSKQELHLYKFGTFTLDPTERLLLNEGTKIKLPPKAFDTLLVLVRNRGHLVERDQLLSEVWSDVFVEEGNITWTISQLRKALGDSPSEPQYIETVPGRGYRFIAPVRELPEVEAEPADKSDTDREAKSLVPDPVGDDSMSVHSLSAEVAVTVLPFRGHLLHILISSSLYASLYTGALFLEVAYRFDQLGPAAVRLAPWLFTWMCGTSILGLWLGRARTREGKSGQLAASLGVFIGAAFLPYVMLGRFLPSESVTDANFQTYTAHVAYLKSVCYFLLLAVSFMIIPFHLVVALRRELRKGNYQLVAELLRGKRSSTPPSGALYLKVWWLGAILLSSAVLALVLTAHLFENLKSGPHMNMFMQMAQWRLILFFLLGAECLAWYYHSLNEIRRAVFSVRS